MDKKLQFNTLLTELVDIANNNNNIIDKETVDNHFKEINLAPEMYIHIYTYLKENKIFVAALDAGNEPTINDPAAVLEESLGLSGDFDITEEENHFVEMYYEELENIPALSENQELSLILSFVQNQDKESKKILTESNLKLVIELIERFSNKGISIGDLIQEGNLGLIEGISTFHGTSDRVYLDFKEYLRQSIAAAMQNAIDENIGCSRINEHLAERANMLDHASTTLAEKLGREATLKELANHLSLTEDEVRNIMKYSLDALNTVN